MDKPPEAALAFCLIERILQMLKESGATLEQSKAALQAAEAILPVADFSSRTNLKVHFRA